MKLSLAQSSIGESARRVSHQLQLKKKKNPYNQGNQAKTPLAPHFKLSSKYFQKTGEKNFMVRVPYYLMQVVYGL